jgi:hypothetical protein
MWVLLDVVNEVFVLVQHNVDTGINLDTFNGRRVGAALVYCSLASVRKDWGNAQSSLIATLKSMPS